MQLSQLKQSAMSSAVLVAQVNQVIVKHEAQNLHSNKAAANSQHLIAPTCPLPQTFTFKDHPPQTLIIDTGLLPPQTTVL